MGKKTIFISHSSKNADKAKKLCDYLEANDKQCFIAPRDIRKGFEYAEEIINGIDNSFVIILLLSREANNSPHVLREIERAVSKKIPVIIYKMEEVELTKSLEYFLMTHQWIDKDNGFDTILEAINDRENVIQSSDENQQLVYQNKKSIFSNKAALIVIAGIVLIVGIIGAMIGIAMHSKKTSDSLKADKVTDKSQIENDDVKTTLETWNVGDEVTFGRYNGKDIYWRVLRKNDDGTYMLVSSEIISVKAFDAAESGQAYVYEDETYIGRNKPDINIEAYITGDNSWDTSNIRTWLNSNAEVVDYEDTPPKEKAMSDGKNAYNVESGFLYDFTEEEFKRIVEVENITKGNVLRDYEDITTKDKVYLLSEDELGLFDEAGISKYAKLTDKADSLDKAQWKNLYMELMNSDYGIYWLRDCVADSATNVKVMANGNIDVDIIEVYSACCDGIGIRPVINVR